MGGIGKAFKRIVSAPFKLVGKVLGSGTNANVSAPAVSAAQVVPAVSAAQVVPSTAAAAPEAPVLGTENTTQDARKKKKGKSRLLINNDSQSSNSSGYSGLNI